MPTKLSLAEDKKSYLISRGFKPARFTDAWLKQNPTDRGREILAKEKSGGDLSCLTVWKFGQKTVGFYSKNFVEFL